MENSDKFKQNMKTVPRHQFEVSQYKYMVEPILQDFHLSQAMVGVHIDQNLETGDMKFNTQPKTFETSVPYARHYIWLKILLA